MKTEEIKENILRRYDLHKSFWHDLFTPLCEDEFSFLKISDADALRYDCEMVCEDMKEATKKVFGEDNRKD
jgi:hypothetical protein